MTSPALVALVLSSGCEAGEVLTVDNHDGRGCFGDGRQIDHSVADREQRLQIVSQGQTWVKRMSGEPVIVGKRCAIAGDHQRCAGRHNLLSKSLSTVAAVLQALGAQCCWNKWSASTRRRRGRKRSKLWPPSGAYRPHRYWQFRCHRHRSPAPQSKRARRCFTPPAPALR